MPRKAVKLWINRQTHLIDGQEPRYVFDPEQWHLGTLCKWGCRFPGTNQSLRRNDKRATTCACRYYGEDWLFKFLDQSSVGIDTTKSRLGNLCKNNHDWKGTGKSLRRINQGACYGCEALRRQDPKRKKQCAELGKRWYQRNRERHIQCSMKNYFARKANDPVGQKLRRSINKHKRKARLNLAHTTQITNTDIRVHISARHQDACVYCGSTSKIVYDHFIPLAKGGPHVLGNLVPACQRCNSSKQDKDPKEWYFEQPFASKKHWERILKLLNLKIEDDIAQLSLL